MTTKFISDMGPKSALIAPRPLKPLAKTDMYIYAKVLSGSRVVNIYACKKTLENIKEQFINTKDEECHKHGLYS